MGFKPKSMLRRAGGKVQSRRVLREFFVRTGRVAVDPRQAGPFRKEYMVAQLPRSPVAKNDVEIYSGGDLRLKQFINRLIKLLRPLGKQPRLFEQDSEIVIAVGPGNSLSPGAE